MPYTVLLLSCASVITTYCLYQRCAGAGVQESTPAGVSVFQQDTEQEQE